ncbi:hypothetical protein BC826DRAFT_967698 [Russula brevipes]|nr:hypothetical protein BC826DRAFT_967698 [Russula brevipes]
MRSRGTGKPMSAGCIYVLGCQITQGPEKRFGDHSFPGRMEAQNRVGGPVGHAEAKDKEPPPRRVPTRVPLSLWEPPKEVNRSVPAMEMASGTTGKSLGFKGPRPYASACLPYLGMDTARQPPPKRRHQGPRHENDQNLVHTHRDALTSGKCSVSSILLSSSHGFWGLPRSNRKTRSTTPRMSACLNLEKFDKGPSWRARLRTPSALIIKSGLTWGFLAVKSSQSSWLPNPRIRPESVTELNRGGCTKWAALPPWEVRGKCFQQEFVRRREVAPVQTLLQFVSAEVFASEGTKTPPRDEAPLMTMSKVSSSGGNGRFSSVSVNFGTCFEKYLIELRTCWSRRSNLGESERLRQQFKCLPHYVEVNFLFTGT